MKHIFTYLLIISIGVNIYFLIEFLNDKKISDEKRKLNFWKEISHNEGYAFLENKMKMDFPEANFKQKTCIVYFWDSTFYDFKYSKAMHDLDSLATSIGEYKFNYIFATEMNENATKKFLARHDAKFKNFKVLGGMDDFISGVYNENPLKWKRIGPNKNNNKIDSDCPDMSKMKVKGYYFLMDNNGRILYHNYKYSSPILDTSFMIKLNSYPSVERSKN